MKGREEILDEATPIPLFIRHRKIHCIARAKRWRTMVEVVVSLLRVKKFGTLCKVFLKKYKT